MNWKSTNWFYLVYISEVKQFWKRCAAVLNSGGGEVTLTWGQYVHSSYSFMSRGDILSTTLFYTWINKVWHWGRALCMAWSTALHRKPRSSFGSRLYNRTVKKIRQQQLMSFKGLLHFELQLRKMQIKRPVTQTGMKDVCRDVKRRHYNSKLSLSIYLR